MKKYLSILLLLAPLFVFGQTQIKFNQVNPTLPANFTIHNSGKIFGLDSLYAGVHTVYATPSGGIYGFGSSIMFGTGTTGGQPGWFAQLCTLMGLTSHNFAGSGNTVENRTPSGAGGGTSFLTQTASIPTYSGLSGTNYLIVETGPNDWHVGYTNYNTTNYSADLTTFLNDILADGWPANHVLVLNNSFVNSSTYGVTGTGGLTLTQAGYLAFQAVTKSVTASAGMLYFDVNDYLANRGGNALVANLHPNNLGHTIEAKGVYSFLSNSVVYAVQPNSLSTTQPLTVNGQAAISYLNMGNDGLLKDQGNTILGRDVNGNIASLNSLPTNTLTGAIFGLNGKVEQYGVDTTNITLGINDWVVSQIKINAAYTPNNNYYGTLSLCTNSVGLDYKVSGYNLSGATIFSLTAPGGTPLTVTQGGAATFGGAITATGFIAPFSGVGFSANVSGNSGGFLPFGSDISGIGSATTYLNYPGGVGGIEFKTAPVTTNTFLERMKIDNVSGNVTIGIQKGNTNSTASNSLYNLDVSGTVRNEDNTYYGIVLPPVGALITTPSTTGGTLPAGNKFYKLVSIDAFGNQSNPSAEFSNVTTGSTGSVSCAFPLATNAVSYQLWTGTTTGAETKYITGTTSPIVDIGSGYTTATIPVSGVNKTSIAQISSGGAATLTSVNINSTQTTVNNSTSGTTTFSEPEQGSSYKVVIIKFNLGLGTASYTFPTAFTTTPSVVGSDDVAAALVTSKSTSAVTVTGSTSTGTLMLIGY